MTARILPLLIACALGAATPPALAGEVEAAKHVQIQEEMQSLAKRNAWTGVERGFQELEQLALDGEPLGYEDYYLGAQAAQALGNMGECESRLKLALGLRDSPEVISWLENLDKNYGPVSLSFERGVKQAELEIAAMPFAPEQRKTIEVAQARLAEDRRFEGLLPIGQYTFGGNEFTIVEGDLGEDLLKIHLTEDAVVSQDSSEGFRFTYVGPRAQLGAAYTVAGTPEGSQQPPSFGGLGARLGAGLEVGLGIRFGAMVEVGYQNLISPSDTGYGDSLHLGYGMLGGSYRVKDIWLGAGGIFAAGVSKASGINDVDSVNSDCPFGSTDESCSWVAAIPEDDRGAYPWSGNVRPAGLQLSASYAVIDIGDSLAGAITLTGGALFDPDRSYPWGQLAFTVAPVPTRSE